VLQRIKPNLLLVGILFTGLLSASIGSAQDTVFTILSKSDDSEAEVGFSLDQLDEFPQVTVLTENEFVDGMNAFTGPLARVVLKQTNDINAKTVKMIAANQYHIEVPVEDFRKYDVILATRQNGELFSRRDKGPIWLIYPMSDHKELRDSTYNARLIWQLVRMEVLSD